KLQAEGVAEIEPSGATIKLIQDKWNQKVHLAERGLPGAGFLRVDSVDEARTAGTRFGFPFVRCSERIRLRETWLEIASSFGGIHWRARVVVQVLKSRFGAYDGRGN